MKSLSDLLSTPDPAWPILQSWIVKAKHPVEVLPPDTLARDHALQACGVSVHSMMGAVAYETGGLLVDQGWVRILGSGHPKLPRRIDRWNFEMQNLSMGDRIPFWLIADDIVGGFFALDGGAFKEANGFVWYYAPDTLKWESLDRGYTDFLDYVFNGDLQTFYENARWRGWQQQMDVINGDQIFGIYPPLWSEPKLNVDDRSRRPLAVREAYRMNVIDLPRQLAE